MSNSLQHHGLQPTKFLCLWDSLGKDTGVGCHVLLQGIFPTQRSNFWPLCVLNWQVGSSTLVSPWKPHILYIQSIIQQIFNVCVCVCVYVCVCWGVYSMFTVTLCRRYFFPCLNDKATGNKMLSLTEVGIYIHCDLHFTTFADYYLSIQTSQVAVLFRSCRKYFIIFFKAMV